MTRYLGKEEIEKLKSAIENVKDIDAGIVMTTRSFAAMGKTINLMALISASIQQLVDSGVFNKNTVEVMFDTISYSKDEDEKIKELAQKIKKLIEDYDEEEK